jgi:hypothetical protein
LLRIFLFHHTKQLPLYSVAWLLSHVDINTSPPGLACHVNISSRLLADLHFVCYAYYNLPPPSPSPLPTCSHTPPPPDSL